MKATSPPSTLFIEITRECNSRCRYCHMWTLKDGPESLSTEEKAAAIRDFAKMNPHGQVVFTGGEVMMKDEFWHLIGEARKSGLLSATNTNGSYVGPENHERLLADGPDHLVFSLDSHIAEVHDYHRGLAGAFTHTVETLRELVRLRGSSGSRAKTQLFTNSVLTDRNIEHLLTYAAFATDLGLDGCTFQVLSPTFHRKGRGDVFYRKHFFPDRPAAIAVLQVLRDRLAEFPVIKTTDNDLRWMQSYIFDPAALTEPICNSHERNMMVDYQGEVLLCFDMRQIFDGRSVGNIRTSGLGDLWGGEVAHTARGIMESCRKPCGMLNCHRRPAA
jgi:MoaA/NifB/PqqE/SkfB family radical SAM enzyme